MSEGIGNDPQSWNDWLNRVIPILNQRGDWRAQGDFYAANALDVGQGEGQRVQTFADILRAYPGVECHGWGHSNGTRVVLDGWAATGPDVRTRPRLTTVHLLCGACDADCDANGINAGLLAGTLGDVFIYVADQDEAMRIEDTLPGKALFQLPFGHRPLGLAGPENVNPAVGERVHVIHWPAYGHSTCWDADHFSGTVTQVMSLAEQYSIANRHSTAAGTGTGGSATGVETGTGTVPEPAGGTPALQADKPDLAPRQEGERTP